MKKMEYINKEFQRKLIAYFRIKFQWSKDKQNRIRPSGGGKTRRKSHKPNTKLRPERTQHRYNNQENDSVSVDNAVPSPSISDAPVQLQSEQKRKSRHDEAIFIESQPMQQRRPSYRQHEQRRCSRKSEVTDSFCQHVTTNHKIIRKYMICFIMILLIHFFFSDIK